MSFPSLSRALHEFYAARESDGGALGGLVFGLGLGLADQPSPARPLLWVRHAMMARETGEAYPPGFAEYGLDPSRLILVRARDAMAALQAGLEGVRAPVSGAVLIELWGEAKAYDLTASRRLALAAKASNTPVLILRAGASPQPSAAETRWQVSASPSRALAANAPGNPAFELTLLRARNGRESLRYHLEWNRDSREFAACSIAATAGFATGDPLRKSGAAPVSGALVPVFFDRPGAPPGEHSPQRQAG